jgi:2-dehydropantoate 2-reductase
VNILIVGAGAIGKIYAYHLSKGGARVSFFVKEKYAQETKAGFQLYPLRHFQNYQTQKPIFWKAHSVFSNPADLKNEKWDYVILAMSSPALRSGWLEPFLVNVKGSNIVSLQPGMHDHDFLIHRVSERKLIESTLACVSMDVPLADEPVVTPGTAFWFPPLAKAMMSGEEIILGPLMEIFEKGGLPAHRTRHAHLVNLVTNPFLTLFVTVLKQSGWSFSTLRHSRARKPLCLALREAAAIQAHYFEVKSPLGVRFVKPWMINIFLNMAPWGAPFPVEACLKKHFTKVWDQMAEHLDQLISYGKEHGMAVGALESLKFNTYPR